MIEESSLNYSEVGNAVSTHVAQGFSQPLRGRMMHGGPDSRTEKQVVQELGLRRGQKVMMPDGVERIIRKITTNGEVFVRGIRDKINVRALQVQDM